MKPGKVSVFINHEPNLGGTALYILLDDVHGQRHVAKPINLEFGELAPAERCQPTMFFSHHQGSEFLSSLADGLAMSGFRPKELEGHDREIVAVRQHLDDMRALVFKERIER